MSGICEIFPEDPSCVVKEPDTIDVAPVAGDGVPAENPDATDEMVDGEEAEAEMEGDMDADMKKGDGKPEGDWQMTAKFLKL